MRRLLLPTTAGLVSACGLLSGLDALEVGEAGASADGMVPGDAPTDTASTVGDADAGRPDDAPTESGTMDDSGHVVRCGGNLVCSVPGQHCCATIGSSNTAYKCSNSACLASELTLNCDDAYDCLDASLICCFSTLQKVGSACATSCSPQNGATLCVPDAQPTGCGASGTNTCVRFDSGYPVDLGRCN